MKTTKAQNLFLSLLIGTGIIAGCSMPASIGENLKKDTSIGNSSTVTISDLQSAKIDLAGLYDDEDVFDDSESLLNDSFSIKSENNSDEEKMDEKNNGDMKNLDEHHKPPMVREGKLPPLHPEAFLKKKPLREMKMDDFRKFERENARQIRAEFRNVKPRLMLKPFPRDGFGLEEAAKLSSAVTINDDGTITIDPLKLQSEIKKVLEARKRELEKRLASINKYLKNFKDLSKEKVNKLKKKNNIVKNTDKVVTNNEDGTVTETMTVKFENTKQGVTRENTVVKTLKDGNVLSIDHTLKTTTKNYTKTTSRIVTFNEDGSKLVKTNSLTEWKNGRKVERNEERLVSSNGSASGSGTITITSKDGKVKTYNLSLSKTLSGELSSTLKDNETKQEVQIVKDNETAVEVVTSEKGNKEQQEVNLEQVISEV